MGDALPSSWLVMPRAQDRNLLWPNTKLSPQESKRSHLKRPTILIPTKFVSLSLIINDRLVRQIIRSAKTCIVREGGKATVVTSSVITKSHGMGSRLGEFWVLVSKRGPQQKIYEKLSLFSNINERTILHKCCIYSR